jgi:hypothetical protein
VALNRRAGAPGYVQDVLASVRRNVETLPAGASEAFDVLEGAYRGSTATVDLNAVVRDATPPVRCVSGFHRRGACDDADLNPPGAADSIVPDVVRAATRGGDFSIWFPDFIGGGWAPLVGLIERGVLDHLLRADGIPAYGHQIEGLRAHPHRATTIVWKINDSASAGIGAARGRLIETTGASPRKPGQPGEPLHARVFFIRPHRWRIPPTIEIRRLEHAKDAIVECFGIPTRPERP